MEDVTYVLKENSKAIRKKIKYAGIEVCTCSRFKDADWLEMSTAVNNGVHGLGYPFEGMTKEETLALFQHECRNPYYCKDVDEFISKILEFRNKYR